MAKAARPGRLLALRLVALTWGGLVRLNWVPANASRQFRHKASGWRAGWASAGKPRGSHWLKTSPGRRRRRSLKELSHRRSSKSCPKCSANVPALCITSKTSAGSTWASGRRGRRPRRWGKPGRTAPKQGRKAAGKPLGTFSEPSTMPTLAFFSGPWCSLPVAHPLSYPQNARKASGLIPPNTALKK